MPADADGDFSGTPARTILQMPDRRKSWGVKRGESGREAFKGMFAAATRREWDCLLFWSLDRFSREGDA
jgi:hypothetical protein